MPPFTLPRVSVALCTYNGARHLGEQLRSIAAQTLPPWELVISDDGSTDTTEEVVTKFEREAPFPVRFQRQRANLGVAQNFGVALTLCQGDLVALCDQDDVWPPDRLEAFAKFLDTHPHCLAVFSDATVVDETLQPIGPPSSLWQCLGLRPQDRRRLRDPLRGLAALADRFVVTGAALVVRRQLLSSALPIPQNLPYKVIHDYWLALVAAALGGLESLPQSTLLYRQHPQQQIGVPLEPPSDKRAPLARPRAKYGARAVRLAAIHAALASHLPSTGPTGAALAILDAKAKFLSRRAEWPDSPWERVCAVAREAVQGNYQRFCQMPVAAALRDLLP